MIPCFIGIHASESFNISELYAEGATYETKKDRMVGFLHSGDDTYYGDNYLTILTPGIGETVKVFGIDTSSSTYTIDNNSLVDYLNRRGSDIFVVSTGTSTPTLTSVGSVKTVIEAGDVICVNLGNSNGGHDIYHPDASHAAYDDLADCINYCIFDYVHNNNELFPKINLIGHSRGGIVNMEYAIEHPLIVESLYSIGTPYNGSSLYDDLHSIINLNITYLPISQCVNSNIYESIKGAWNVYQNNNTYSRHTKLYAISSLTSIDFIESILDEYSSESIDNVDFFQNHNILNKIVKYMLKCYLNVSLETPQSPDIIVDVFDTDYNNSNTYSLTHNIQWRIDVLGFLLTQGIHEEVIHISELDVDLTKQDILSILEYIADMLSNLKYDYFTDSFYVENDLFVNKSSQEAYGYNNVEVFTKIFTSTNSQLNGCSELYFGNSYFKLFNIPHGLEPGDEDIINCILSNINLGSKDSGFNIKKSTENNEIVYEYIGFYYKNAVDEGSMTISQYCNSKTIINSKMFDCNRSLGQKLYKNTDSATQHLNNDLTDGITEITFDGIINLSDLEVFAYLKGRAKFYFNIDSYLYYNNTVISIYDYSLKYNTKLLKNGSLAPFVIGEVCTGALLNQDIDNISFFLTQGIVIGDYAFYGCHNLNSIDNNSNLGINSIGVFSFCKSGMAELNSYIVDDYLVSCNSIICEIPTNIHHIAPTAFYYSGTKCVKVEDSTILFENYSLYGSQVEYIDLETIDENGYNFTFTNELINMITDGAIILVSTIPSSILPLNSYNLTNNITISFDEYTISHNFQGEIYDRLDLINDVCLHDYVFLLGTATQKVDICINCGKIVYHIHSYNTYQIDDSFHMYSCVCNYSFQEAHVVYYTKNGSIGHFINCSICEYHVQENHDYFIDNSYLDGSLPDYYHNFHCSLCDHNHAEPHDEEQDFYIEDNVYKYGFICSVCDNKRARYIGTVSQYDENYHFVDCVINTELFEHEMIDFVTHGITLSICIYCSYHEHYGNISQANSDYHTMQCYICNTILYYEHSYENYININNDIIYGTHSKTCSICNYQTNENHQYVIANDYIDNHHLQCVDCNAITIYYHESVLSNYIDQFSHTQYCDFCDCYYLVSHTYQIDDTLTTDISHSKRCDICEYLLVGNHDYVYQNASDTTHTKTCNVCSHQVSENHNLVNNCVSSDVHDHTLNCVCGYSELTEKSYTIIYEYSHYIKCNSCNNRTVEPHDEKYTNQGSCGHLYHCELCEIEYLMPHFVNDHVIIYYYDEIYDLYVCTAYNCGYQLLVRRGENQ